MPTAIARPSLLPLILVLAVTWGRAGAEEVRRFDLQTLSLAACRVTEGRITLGDWFAAPTAGALAMEAEEGLDIIADLAGGVEDPAASGGRYLAKVDRLVFPVRIATPGTYRRWVRAQFPTAGTWIHQESMDFAEPRWYTDSQGEPAPGWVWVSGPTYELSAGVHLLWLHNWHGGAKLDKIALLPEGAEAPEGIGPEATSRSAAQSGWALTPLLSVPGLRQVTEARWPAETGDGEVEVLASVDSGRSFRPLGDGPLEPAPGAALQLRAELTAGQGAGPSLGGPTVRYSLDPEAFVVLENDRLKATFLRATGGLVELWDKAAGVACTRSGRATAPFSLRHLTPGDTAPDAIGAEETPLTDMQVSGSSLTARYRFAEGGAVVLSVRLRGAELDFCLDVDNGSSLDIVEVVCPVVDGVCLGDSAEDDRLLTPNWQGGVEILHPAQSGGGSVSYPAGGGMAWLDLYETEPAHGLYLSSHDTSLMGCQIGARSEAQKDTLTFAVTKYAHVRSGTRWKSPVAVIGAHSGDWHAAADAYRAWAETWMAKPQPPEWVREADGWYGLVVSADSNHIKFSRIPEFLGSMRKLGTNYIQVWGQMTGGSNCDSLPYPNPVLGTLDEFRAAVAEVQKWGAHITFYVSSQFWKVDYGEGEMIGSTPRALLPPGVPTWDWGEWRGYAIRSYAGECSGDTELSPQEQEKYGTRWRRTVPCPFTDAWANRHLHYWCVSQYGESYGANGIYLDETGAAGERICFSDGHGHEHHGIWGASLARIMDRMVADGRAADPNWMFAMEGCNDAIGQFADVNLVSPASAKQPGQWGPNRIFMPQVFHYTFPDYILYDGVANGTYGVGSEQVFSSVHLIGHRYDSFGQPEAVPYVALRQRTKQVLYRARFMDDIGVATDDPAVQAKTNVLRDDANDLQIVNVTNPEGVEGATVTVAESAEGLWAYYFDIDGEEGQAELVPTAGGVGFTAPTSRAATVIVARRCEPLVQVPVAEVVAGDAALLQVTVTNTGPVPLRGTVQMEGEAAGEGFSALEIRLAPRCSTRVELALKLPAATPRGCLTGHLLLTGEGFSVRRPVEVLVRGPFALDGEYLAARHAVQLQVANASGIRHDGRLRVTGSLWTEPVETDFTVGPGETAPVTVPCAARRALTEPTDLEVVVTGAGETETFRVHVRPPLVNGGFELTAATGRPAAWEYQQAELATSDDVDPAEGLRCLKLSGQPGAFLEAHQTLDLERGVTYTARCKMRRSEGTGRIVGPCVVLYLKAGGERYVHLKKVSDAPDAEWNRYEATFSLAEDVERAMLYLYNVDSTATAWFDAAEVG